MLNANLVLLVFSLKALSLTFLFSFFVLLILLFYIFLGVHVCLIGGADSCCLHREPNVNFITEDVFLFFTSNIKT